MTLDPDALHRFQALARELAQLDTDAYRKMQREPLAPILGLGPADAPVCFFGRDPGAEELRLGQPFVGAAGRLLREGLLARMGEDTAGPFAAERMLAAGERFFWLNTVPYKPLGNKAWPAGVRASFRPLIAQLLLGRWRGRHVVTLGKEAFMWFGIDQVAETRRKIGDRWREVLNPGVGPLKIEYRLDGETRPLCICPLPHPSPRNVRGRAVFPALLDECLRALPLSGEAERLPSA